MDSGEELVAFLCARYFDAERVALAATHGVSGRWQRRGGGVEFGDGSGDWPDWSGGGVVVRDEGAPTVEQAEHIARNDPAYVLADIAAKLQVLAEVRSWTHCYNDPDPYFSCSQAVGHWRDDSQPGSGCADEDRQGKPCDCGLDRRRLAILAPLASPFAGHPEFQETWRLT